ncbi:SURF1 family protein [Vibrio scophthalmi]|uniref:SURF1 family protein n=1 Tax=Vibrio scophthalmi TaxID=45658 RepID=UPI00228403B9|nr:SURF1 family protein [Vibrio scophthalmi]MCY9804210.1 SURF1 family protein [Vibrio scophthalmi]
MKTIALSLSELIKQPSFWLALILTVVAISILVNLGLWQLNRAEQKQAIQQELDSKQRQTLLPLDDVQPSQESYLTGQRVDVLATPIHGKYLLLDNQVFEGNVGYLAIQLMKTAQGRYVLLERGFIPAGVNRSILPEVNWLDERYQGEGRLYVRSNNPLSDALMAEDTWPVRIQNLNIAALSRLWQYPIERFVVQPQSIDQEWDYPQPWNPLPMSAGKHIGYAVQWFAMAVALAILALIWLSLAVKSKQKVVNDLP